MKRPPPILEYPEYVNGAQARPRAEPFRAHSRPGLRARAWRRVQASGRGLDPVARWPCSSRAARLPPTPMSKNDCASPGEVVVYQPERTAVNQFVHYKYRFPNGQGNPDARILAKVSTYVPRVGFTANWRRPAPLRGAEGCRWWRQLEPGGFGRRPLLHCRGCHLRCL